MNSLPSSRVLRFQHRLVSCFRPAGRHVVGEFLTHKRRGFRTDRLRFCRQLAIDRRRSDDAFLKSEQAFARDTIQHVDITGFPRLCHGIDRCPW